MASCHSVTWRLLTFHREDVFFLWHGYFGYLRSHHLVVQLKVKDRFTTSMADCIGIVKCVPERQGNWQWTLNVKRLMPRDVWDSKHWVCFPADSPCVDAFAILVVEPPPLERAAPHQKKEECGRRRIWLSHQSYQFMSFHIKYNIHNYTYHIISYHIISFHFISFHFISIQFISFHFISSYSYSYQFMFICIDLRTCSFIRPPLGFQYFGKVCCIFSLHVLEFRYTTKTLISHLKSNFYHILCLQALS